jgi:hypothetical protein
VDEPHPSSCLLFYSGEQTLHDAERALRRRALQVERVGDMLRVWHGEGSVLGVSMSEQPAVATAARELARERGEAELADCTRCFRIEIGDLAVALAEVNTLIEVQLTLGDLVQAWRYNTWNSHLSSPEQA